MLHVRLVSLSVLLAFCVACGAIGGLVGLGGSSSGDVPPDVHVIALIVQSPRDLPRDVVEEKLMSKLLDKKYRVPSRHDIEAILNERGIDIQHIDSNAEVALTLLKSDALMIVKLHPIERFKENEEQMVEIRLGARLINKKGELLWSSAVDKTKRLDELRRNQHFEELASKVARAFPRYYPPVTKDAPIVDTQGQGGDSQGEELFKQLTSGE